MDFALSVGRLVMRSKYDRVKRIVFMVAPGIASQCLIDCRPSQRVTGMTPSVVLRAKV